MPLYSILLAHDTSAYGVVAVEADDLAAAVEKVRADLDSDVQTLWNEVSEIDWSTSYNYRVVTVQLDDPTALSDLLADGIQLSGDDDGTPRSAEAVLADVTKHRLTK
jgi:hypothetical protein